MSGGLSSRRKLIVRGSALAIVGLLGVGTWSATRELPNPPPPDPVLSGPPIVSKSGVALIPTSNGGFAVHAPPGAFGKDGKATIDLPGGGQIIMFDKEPAPPPPGKK